VNQLAGKAAERIVKEQSEAEGNTIIASQVAVRTSQGLRIIDHLIQTPADELVAVEVKSGGGVRSASQVAKDNLMATEGATIVSSKIPRLQGTHKVLQTIERRVP